jgi:hypothetical protein
MSEPLADDDAGIVLLKDVRDMFEKRGVDRMASAEIVEALGEREDRPWSKWKDDKPITPRQLARLLEPFAVSPTTIWTARKATKGYRLASLADAFTRYVPASYTPPRAVSPLDAAENSHSDASKSVRTPATSMTWIQNNDRRWAAVAKRWQREHGAPLRAQSDPGNPGASGYGAFVPAHWLAGGRP